MDVTLTPELERFVEEKVKAGNYQTPSDVVRDGLQMLKDKEENRSAFEAVKNEIAIGIGEADRGELEDVDEGLAERVRTSGRKKLEAWRNNNGV
jgi:antitoxin ParD1/3/4